MSEFIDFLTKHGPQAITTYAISHNGIFYLFFVYFKASFIQEDVMICIVYLKAYTKSIRN